MKLLSASITSPPNFLNVRIIYDTRMAVKAKLARSLFPNYTACQTRTTLSSPAEAIRVPSGDHAIVFMTAL